MLAGDARARTGLLATAFLVSYMVTAPIFGWLADRMARWLIPVWSVGAFSLALPVNRLPVLEQGAALILAMAVIAIVVAASVRGVVLLLTDMALITEELAGRVVARHAVHPQLAP